MNYKKDFKLIEKALLSGCVTIAELALFIKEAKPVKNA